MLFVAIIYSHHSLASRRGEEGVGPVGSFVVGTVTTPQIQVSLRSWCRAELERGWGTVRKNRTGDDLGAHKMWSNSRHLGSKHELHRGVCHKVLCKEAQSSSTHSL